MQNPAAVVEFGSSSCIGHGSISAQTVSFVVSSMKRCIATVESRLPAQIAKVQRGTVTLSTTLETAQNQAHPTFKYKVVHVLQIGPSGGGGVSVKSDLGSRHQKKSNHAKVKPEARYTAMAALAGSGNQTQDPRLI
jgi:hypothetical protein